MSTIPIRELLLEDVLVLYPIDESLVYLESSVRELQSGSTLTISVPDFIQKVHELNNGPFTSLFTGISKLFTIDGQLVRCFYTLPMLVYALENPNLNLEIVSSDKKNGRITVECRKK